MPALTLALDRASDSFAANRRHTLELIEQWRAIEARTRAASAKAGPLFEKRGQLLPRERVTRLLDPGVPFLELSTLAASRTGPRSERPSRVNPSARRSALARCPGAARASLR